MTRAAALAFALVDSPVLRVVLAFFVVAVLVGVLVRLVGR